MYVLFRFLIPRLDYYLDLKILSFNIFCIPLFIFLFLKLERDWIDWGDRWVSEFQCFRVQEFKGSRVQEFHTALWSLHFDLVLKVKPFWIQLFKCSIVLSFFYLTLFWKTIFLFSESQIPPTLSFFILSFVFFISSPRNIEH